MSDRNWLVFSILIGLLCLALGIVLWRGSGTASELSGGDARASGESAADEPVTTPRREAGAASEPDAAETSPAPVTVTIEGSISAVDETGAPVLVEEGRLDYEIFNRDGPSPRPAARVAKGRFSIALAPDDELFMTGRLRFGRGYVCENWDDAWIERRDLLAEGLRLRTQIGALRRIRVLDSTSREELEGIEIHSTWPWFVTDADGRRGRPGPLATENSPLDLRPGCGTSKHFVLTRPGYAPRPLGEPQAEFELDAAGRLEVRVAADWPKIDGRNRLRLRIEPQESSASWRSAAWPDFDLRGPRHARLVFDRVPIGNCGVALVAGAAGVLEEQVIEIRAGAIARVDFGAGLEGLEYAPTHLRGRIHGWPGRPFANHRSFSLQLGRGTDPAWRSAAIAGQAEILPSPPRETIEFEFKKILPGRLRLDFLGHVLPIDLPPEGLDDFRIDLENLPLVEIVIRDQAGRLLGPDQVEMTQQPFGALCFSASRGAFLAPSRRHAVEYRILTGDGEPRGPRRFIRERAVAENRRIEREIGPEFIAALEIKADGPQVLGHFKSIAGGDEGWTLVEARTAEGRKVDVEGVEVDGDFLRIWLASPGQHQIALDPRHGYRGEARVEARRPIERQAPPVPLRIDLINENMRAWFGLGAKED